MTEPGTDRNSTWTSAEAAFFAMLQDLHARAGEPSSREMAKGIGGVSHTTLNAAIRGTNVPSWNVTQKVVEYLGGDLEAFRQAWTEVRQKAQSRRPQSGPEISIFVSYARIDDKSSYERISKMIGDIAATYESMTGRVVGVFKDVESITPGDDWRDRIRLGLSSSSVFLAFITPAYLRSANCREELSEFLAFLDANSSSRLIVPLLFAAPDRIANEFGGDVLWERIASLQRVDVSGLRYQEPGASAWMIIVDQIVETITDVLKSFSSGGGRPDSEDEADREPDLSAGVLDRLAEIEATVMPQVNESIQRYGTLMEQLNDVVSAAAAPMERADSFARKLAVSRQLAMTLGPIADEMVIEAERIVNYLTEVTYYTNLVIDIVRKDSNEAPIQTIEMLKTVRDTASIGVESFAAIETFARSIEAAIGFSRELDKPLKKVRRASLKIADLRGIFSGWREEVGSLQERYPDLRL